MREKGKAATKETYINTECPAFSDLQVSAFDRFEMGLDKQQDIYICLEPKIGSVSKNFLTTLACRLFKPPKEAKYLCERRSRVTLGCPALFIPLPFVSTGLEISATSLVTRQYLQKMGVEQDHQPNKIP